MNKSLLSILYAEHSLVPQVNSCEWSINYYRERIDELLSYDYGNCELSDSLLQVRKELNAEYLDLYNSKLATEIAEAGKLQSELAEVRSEMRTYFEHLFEKGGKGNG